MSSLQSSGGREARSNVVLLVPVLNGSFPCWGRVTLIPCVPITDVDLRDPAISRIWYPGSTTQIPRRDVNFCNIVGFIYFRLVLCDCILNNLCVFKYYLYLIVHKTVLLNVKCQYIASDRALLATLPPKRKKFKRGIR